jgi:hypothetical protein
MPTDKIELGYGPTYERIAFELGVLPVAGIGHNSSRRILEVGVAGGAGMEFFRDVFSTTEVYGVDLTPGAGHPDDHPNILTCSQDDPGLPLILQSNGWAPFHVIVDDASHRAGLTSVTLSNLWPLVVPGGYYVIEDWNYFEGPGMASNLWQKLLGHFLASPQVGDPNPHNPYSGVLPYVDSVTIRDGMIIARKWDPSIKGATT